MRGLSRGSLPCRCRLSKHEPALVVLTGGPGAGKTALLELIQQSLCPHLAILPEAASVVFGGGFPRLDSEEARRATQRAVYHIQIEIERIVAAEHDIAVGLCDRGTLDGLAYWPGDERSFFEELDTSAERELARYAAVIHLRTPPPERYDRSNALRIESAREAAGIDARIARAWSRHPRRTEVASTPEFIDKALQALTLVREQLPACCREHVRIAGR